MLNMSGIYAIPSTLCNIYPPQILFVQQITVSFGFWIYAYSRKDKKITREKQSQQLLCTCFIISVIEHNFRWKALYKREQSALKHKSPTFHSVFVLSGLDFILILFLCICDQSNQKNGNISQYRCTAGTNNRVKEFLKHGVECFWQSSNVVCFIFFFSAGVGILFLLWFCF